MKQIISILLTSVLLFTSCKKDVVPQTPKKSYTLSIDSLTTLQTNIPNDIYNDMAFVNETTGYAVSRNGRIIKTIDGGYNWVELLSNVTFYLRKIQFINSQTGYVIGGDATGGYLLKTENGGSSWQKSNLNLPEPGWPTGMYFLNSTTGFVTGKNYFKKTLDGGVTWRDAAGTILENFADVSFKTNTEGFATAGTGKYYRTTNGGISWQLVQSEISNALGEICHSTSKSYAISGLNLIDLQSGKALTSVTLPGNTKRLLFLTDVNSIGIGQHYETGFWPYGDIHLTNTAWESSIKKSYSPASEALDFTAIAKKTDGKVLMLGTALLTTPVVELKY